MSVRMRHTRAHTRNRRSHHSLSAPALTTDKETGTPHMRHRASPITGKYRGRQVIDVDKKIAKKESKRVEQEKEE
jgi:large subunit ribosomal protein L32